LNAGLKENARPLAKVGRFSEAYQHRKEIAAAIGFATI
jgi:hypothetical protein